MSNVDKHRESHRAFNERDFEACVKDVSESLTYTDNPRALSLKSKGEFLDWLKGWAQAFSDAKADEPNYIDGGSYTVAMFRGRGTNDGDTEMMPATNKRMDMPFCEILHWGEDGKADKGEVYYDAMTMMVQLGVAEPPPTA